MLLNKIIRLVALSIVAAVASGCAHKITISPDLAKIEAPADTPRINANVAYYIAEADLAKTVKTPGGGGDKVTYQPYKEIETAFYKMLSNVFTNVIKIKTPEPTAADNVDYVVVPTLVTDSSSSSFVTWPPTRFTTNLITKVSGTANNGDTTITVMEAGEAEYSEFIRDFGLAARRSTQAALIKTQEALLAAPALSVKR
ncbi:hypothetical protein [Achromobacter spanius]|uniref:Lipoprotein n=1 Tax=Achromobacter spanius TaxID=217203 RepID=A0AAW3HYV8_9BURK|nr:hypothetical protein [Achromobacter spanius]KNE24433.1 hypothetical protein AFM18_25075 [Achromobacter spanius]